MALDLLFVAVFHWGVAGAAIATVLTQGISFLLCLWRMCRLKDPDQLRQHHPGEDAEHGALFGPVILPRPQVLAPWSLSSVVFVLFLLKSDWHHAFDRGVPRNGGG